MSQIKKEDMKNIMRILEPHNQKHFSYQPLTKETRPQARLPVTVECICSAQTLCVTGTRLPAEGELSRECPE
jgi:hypothetical protein